MLSKSCQCEKEHTLCFCLLQNSRNINQSKELEQKSGCGGNGMMWTVKRDHKGTHG